MILRFYTERMGRFSSILFLCHTKLFSHFFFLEMKERGSKNKPHAHAVLPTAAPLLPRGHCWHCWDSGGSPGDAGLGSDDRARPVVMPGLQRKEKTAWLKADLFSEAQLQLPMEAKEMCVRCWYLKNCCGKDVGLEQQHSLCCSMAGLGLT